MQRLLGVFVAGAGCRRELLALAHRRYKFTAALPERGYRGIAPDVRDELLGMALALPLAVADLRRRPMVPPS